MVHVIVICSPGAVWRIVHHRVSGCIPNGLHRSRIREVLP